MFIAELRLLLMKSHRSTSTSYTAYCSVELSVVCLSMCVIVYAGHSYALC